MRAGYDAAFPVSASWSLEFAPVNVSVLFVQRDGNEHYVIGSHTWFFEELARALAEVREVYPWRVASHLIPPEREPFVWQTIFRDQHLHNVEHAPVLPDGQRMLVTQRFLPRVHVDTVPREWAVEGNNAELIDALNGYRVKEVPGQSNVFSMNVLGSHEQYLTRALEHYAAHDFLNPPGDAWGPAPNYAAHDRAVIAAGSKRR